MKKSNYGLKRLARKLIEKGIMYYNPKAKPGEVIKKYLTEEEKELCKELKPEHFNTRI